MRSTKEGLTLQHFLNWHKSIGALGTDKKGYTIMSERLTNENNGARNNHVIFVFFFLNSEYDYQETLLTR